MNKVFADHVTNTAFFLSVSKKQIRYLDVLHKHPWPSYGYYDRPFSGGRSDPDNWLASYKALVNKGLVIWVMDDKENERGHYELTKAGQLLCDMLIEAELMTQKTLQAVCNE